MTDVELLVLPLREVGAVPRRLAKGLRAGEAAESTTDTSKACKAMSSGLEDVVGGGG